MKGIHQASNTKNLLFSFIRFTVILEKQENTNILINTHIHIYETMTHVLKPLSFICSLNCSARGLCFFGTPDQQTGNTAAG